MQTRERGGRQKIRTFCRHQMYRDGLLGMYVLLSNSQAGPDRTVKARAGRNFSQPRTSLLVLLSTWPLAKRGRQGWNLTARR